MILSHVIFILFLFALGACIGSFLNVVVWRLPRNESLVSPPSHCPKCNTRLVWYDNIPVIGWLALGGKCRYCKKPISPRYPIVEAITGLLFVFYYVMFFIFQVGPCPPSPTIITNDFTGEQSFLPTVLTIQQHWPIYALYMFLIACLFAASLIDAELFIIPIEIPWIAAAVGIIAHALIDRPDMPGALNVGVTGASVAIGGSIGLLISIALFQLGWIKQSFPKGEPLLEVDRETIRVEIEKARHMGRKLEVDETQLPPSYTKKDIRKEIGLEMLFLLPPMLGAFVCIALTHSSPAASRMMTSLASTNWISGVLGALLGALVGGFVVWVTRILGTLGFGRVAMGLGDVHLMFGVGAIIGAGAATVAFFIAPFFGILVAIYMLLTGTRRELPYGPYLGLATAFVMLFYCPIAAYLAPGIEGLINIARAKFGM
ncbi:MAG: prepilin peptidase [Anaerolineae bacterium]|nr:prepilin peptidase [Phycisphaerae bacterium]